MAGLTSILAEKDRKLALSGLVSGRLITSAF